MVVFPQQRLNEIDRKIYSVSVKHLDPGIYNPRHTEGLINSNDFRPDVIDTLRPLRILVFRCPPGIVCATDHRQDGIGSRSKQPLRPESVCGGFDSIAFATHEFMQWCKTLDAEPYLYLNLDTGTLDEALSWLEYCNGTDNTFYADMRRENRHAEPSRV